MPCTLSFCSDSSTNIGYIINNITCYLLYTLYLICYPLYLRHYRIYGFPPHRAKSLSPICKKHYNTIKASYKPREQLLSMLCHSREVAFYQVCKYFKNARYYLIKAFYYHANTIKSTCKRGEKTIRRGFTICFKILKYRLYELVIYRSK